MNIAYSIFVFIVWFLSTYFNVVMLFMLFKNKESFYTSPSQSALDLPKVTIIAPAYNESDTIIDSIESLKKIEYPNELLEIFIVNDGSTDNTAEIVQEQATEPYFHFINNQENKGKAACLNQAIRQASGMLIATMDSDSEVSPDILKKTIPYFENKSVGAVTVTVKVKNPKSLLQKIIEVEYALGLSLSLKVLSYFNSIHVTPGPFSVYRSAALRQIGGFDETNITEDLEIAHRLQKHRFRIECCTTTHVRTVIPDTLRSLYIQRKRWYSGALITFWQHRALVFNPRLGTFGFVLPYMYTLMFLGLTLFGFSLYLSISNILKSIAFYRLTHFNVLSYISWANIDFLKLGALTIFGLMAVVMTIVVAYIALRFSKLRIRKAGFVGFIFLFLLYQVFWASSLYAVTFKKRLKWR
ncbi:MAG TPA: glycosyltransferase [Candidatus Nanoarchaeia archaeon]|nr:glycosyltransferase [Candidatus Nanoarchaeia archaeon]